MTNVRFTIEIPDELLALLRWREEEIAAKTREALVMILLRERKLSQRKAAELLWLTRRELMDLMTHYQIPSIDYEDGWLEHELDVFAKDWDNKRDVVYDNWGEHYKEKPIRVRVENGTLVPLQPIDLPEGAIVLLRIIPPEEIERDIAETIQEVRHSKKPPEPASWPLGAKGTLSRKDIYDDR